MFKTFSVPEYREQFQEDKEQLPESSQKECGQDEVILFGLGWKKANTLSLVKARLKRSRGRGECKS